MPFRSFASILSMGLVIPGCSDCCTGPPSDVSFQTAPSHTSVAEPIESATSPGAEPVSEFKERRKREAVSGLAFEGGRAMIVAEEAKSRVAGPDRAAADLAYAEGLAHRESNETLAAIRAHSDAVLLAPDVAQMYEGLGDALIRQGGWEPRAAAAYRTGLDLEPASVSLSARYADAIWRTGDIDGAVAAWKRLAELDPDRAEAYQRLAGVAFLKGEDALAWEYVHAAESRGGSVPPQMRETLTVRSPEPAK